MMTMAWMAICPVYAGEESTDPYWRAKLPKSAVPMYDKIIEKIKVGDITDIDKLLAELVSKHKTDSVVLAFASETILQLGDPTTGLKYATASVELSSKDPHALYLRGSAYYQLSRYQLAVKDYTAALKLEPKTAYIHYHRGLSYYELEQFNNAIDDLHMAKKFENSIKHHFNYAGMLFKVWRIKESVAEFESYIKRVPDDRMASKALSSMLLHLDRPDDADREFARFRKIDPKATDEFEAAVRKEFTEFRRLYTKEVYADEEKKHRK